MNEVEILLKAKTRCIYIQTYEEEEVVNDLKAILKNFGGMKLKTWSMTNGLESIALTKYETQEPPDRKINDQKLFDTIHSACDSKSKEENIWLLKDLHLISEKAAVIRALRDIKEYNHANYNPIIIVSPFLTIPKEWEKLFTIIDYDLPNMAQIRRVVEAICGVLVKSQTNDKIEMPNTETKEFIAKACSGLTQNEIIDVLKKSAVQYGTLNLQAIVDQKIQLIRKNGVLEYKVAKIGVEDVGGHHAFKDWYEETKFLFREEAVAFGCAAPKGYLGVGVPGAGKTLFAEAIAHDLHIPFIQLKISKVMGKLVGQSEERMIQALKICKACAPCVVLLDEVEKALGGMVSSNNSDSGTLSRVSAELLQFMNDNDNGVFLVMTANDVSQLPKELTRAGRLDNIWYFALPTREEREEIFKIHLRKTGKFYDSDLVEKAALASDNYTGAEIEQVVKISMRKAFKRFISEAVEDRQDCITEDDLLSAIPEIIPLFKSGQEQISALDNWAKGKCRKTNEIVGEEFALDQEDELLSKLRNELTVEGGVNNAWK
jgi:SpoVK/Ycf46/Vps4 family AAA+-type ATPase